MARGAPLTQKFLARSRGGVPLVKIGLERDIRFCARRDRFDVVPRVVGFTQGCPRRALLNACLAERFRETSRYCACRGANQPSSTMKEIVWLRKIALRPTAARCR